MAHHQQWWPQEVIQGCKHIFHGSCIQPVAEPAMSFMKTVGEPAKAGLSLQDHVVASISRTNCLNKVKAITITYEIPSLRTLYIIKSGTLYTGTNPRCHLPDSPEAPGC
jgi:hypothetical protein